MSIFLCGTELIVLTQLPRIDEACTPRLSHLVIFHKYLIHRCELKPLLTGQSMLLDITLNSQTGVD